MKTKTYKIITGCLSICLFLFVAISCNQDDDSTNSGNFNLTEINAMLDQARNLLVNTEEGTMAGDQQPGSKATLESVIAAIEKLIAKSESQADIDDAGLKLEAAIATYQESTVSTAFPYVRQEVNSSIIISENINSILGAGEFTIQGQYYIVDLNPTGFSNNLFATLSGPAEGFSVRYFGDGNGQIVNGDGASFGVADTGAGAFKSGEWIDIALTSSGKSLLKLYINGEEVASLDKNFEQSELNFWIGNSPAFSDRVSNLLVREFTIWNTALDQATIQANSTATFDGTEANLQCYFPFGSDLGNSFADVTGDFTATLNGTVEWVPEPPIIVLDYSSLDAAIQQITGFRGTIEEGDQDGDYPIGTLAFIDSLIANANEVRANEGRQTALDDTASALTASIGRINSNLVGPAEGVFIDSEDPNAIGFRITPNYNPTGDYTYELDLKLRTFFLPTGGLGLGDIFGNGSLGLRVNGYIELTEQSLLNSGGGWNFTNIEGVGFTGPMYPPLTLKSGVWQHVAVVHDDTALTTSIYVDGEMVAQQTDIGVPVPSGFAETWLGNTFGFKITGDIKDFRIWEEARTPAQLNMDITGNEPNLINYFPLDRVNGIFFKDETGNYDGEMRGIVWNTDGQ